MSIKSMEITALDFNKIDEANVFDWLELFGFTRYVEQNYIIPSKSIDPRMPENHISNTPEGLFTSMIVPYYYYNDTMFIIKKEEFDKIKEAFLRVVTKPRKEVDS